MEEAVLGGIGYPLQVPGEHRQFFILRLSG